MLEAGTRLQLYRPFTANYFTHNLRIDTHLFHILNQRLSVIMYILCMLCIL